MLVFFAGFTRGGFFIQVIPVWFCSLAVIVFCGLSPARDLSGGPDWPYARGLLHDNPLNLPRVLLRSAFLSFSYEKLTLVGGDDILSAPPYALGLHASLLMVVQ